MSDSTNELKTQLRDAERKASAAERALGEMKKRRIPLMVWSAVAGFLLFSIGG